MTSDYSEFHGQLGAVARGVLGQAAGKHVDHGQMAAAGWLGLEIPEELEGAGATFAEVAVILHEMGRSLADCGFLGTAVLGVGALTMAEATAPRDDLLRQVACGELALAVAVPTGESAEIGFRLDDEGASTLTGQASFVPDVREAGCVLVVARDPRPCLVVLDSGHLKNPHVEVLDQPVVDSTRRFAALEAVGAGTGESSVLRFAGDAEAAIQVLMARGALAVACDSLGLAEAMMEATVAYAGQRHQFGRAIGSFQAVKHACADMYVEVQICRQLINGAVEKMTLNSADAALATSMAKAHVCDAAVGIVGKAMQLHGGVGYTWEAGIHGYLKRAVLNRSLFGSGRAHRERVAIRYRPL